MAVVGIAAPPALSCSERALCSTLSASATLSSHSRLPCPRHRQAAAAVGGTSRKSSPAPRPRVVRVRAEATANKGLQRSGVLQGGRWLSSTTRHIRIYVGYIDPDTMDMDQTQADKLSLLLDPDNEFMWEPEQEKKVYDKFAELVDNYAGADLTEYTLRLIGSDLEHYIRSLLQAGEIKYNLDSRVLNFSMGKPRYEGLDEA